jgi:hypothetical protein
MTALVDAPAELADALTDAGLRVAGIAGLDPPAAVIVAEGVPDLRSIGRGQVRAQWRVVLVAGAWDSDAAAGQLNAMRATALGVLAGLDGWQLDLVSADAVVALAGSDLLGCDVLTSRMCDLS